MVSKICKGLITLFKSIAASNSDTISPNPNTDDKITPNKWISLFLFIYDMKFFYIQVPLYLWIFSVPKFLCNYDLVLGGFLFYYFLYKKSRPRTRKYSCKIMPKISTEKDKKPSTLKAFTQSLRNRMTPIGYVISEA